MPQLDKFTFLDQSLSVLFFFLIIYILSMYVFLPKILFIVRFRVRFFNLLKLRYILLEQLFNFKVNKIKVFSKRKFFLLYSYLNFILIQNKELVRIIRLINFKN